MGVKEEKKRENKMFKFILAPDIIKTIGQACFRVKKKKKSNAHDIKHQWTFLNT